MGSERELGKALELSFGGDESALEALVERLTPVIARRVIRSLIRSGRPATGCRDLIRDLTQDVFLDIFEQDARVLRGWNPHRGLSLENFVGLVAERRTLRRLSRTPYDFQTSDSGWEVSSRPGSEADPERETLARADWASLLDRVQERASPLGWRLFRLLFVEERSVREIEAETQLRRDAIYAWRSRLRRLVRGLYDEMLEPEVPKNAPVVPPALRHRKLQGGR